jgi:arsenite methyltransferase
MNNQLHFFDFAAEVGLTKHMGGLKATDKLIELCHINKDSYIPDVGCGVGATACYVAEKVGCRLMGVDILDKMVERSMERSSRHKLTQWVEVRQGGILPDHLEEYFSSKLFVGKKTDEIK